MPSPNKDCKGGIDSMVVGSGLVDPQALCGIGKNDGDKDYVQRKACIGRNSFSLLPTSARVLSFLQKKLRTNCGLVQKCCGCLGEGCQLDSQDICDDPRS